MNPRLPWPLMYRDETNDDPYTSAGLAGELEHLELRGEAVWRCHELDRSDAEGRPEFAATMSNIQWFVAETIDRFGYDYARRFVAAVLADDWDSDEHASLIANVTRRFGKRGLYVFAGFLAVHYTADEQWRGRSR